ncbi:hypothetical protein BVRB_019680, partial [Beta vulgaris subsp. vulgaris]
IVAVYDVGVLLSCLLGSISQPMVRCVGHHLPVNVAAAFPISNRFLTGSLDRTCRLWSVGKAEPDFVFEYNSGITSIIVDPAEAFFCVGTVNGQIYRTRLLHSAASLSESSQITTLLDTSAAHSSSITSLALNFDACLMASADLNDSVKIWDLFSCQCIHTLRNISHPRNHYRLVMFQFAKESLVNGVLVSGFCNAQQIEQLQKFPERHESRSTNITIPGALLSHLKYVRAEHQVELKSVANEESERQARLMAQEVAMSQISEERDRWAQVASRLYDICSSQIL